MSSHLGIRTEVVDGLATLTLARPPVNVLDIATMEEISVALAELAADDSLRLLLLTGEGKAFSAGVEVADHTPDKVAAMLGIFHHVVRSLEAFPVPTLAALNGAALGGGLELALVCDLVVAAAGAKLGQPEILLGVFPPVAAVLLPRLLPPVIAHELIYGGANITAEQALGYGLVNRVLPREHFAADARAFAAPFLALSRAALAATRKAVRAAGGHAFAPALQAAENIYLQELMHTADAAEGLVAFLDNRRAPVWKHR